MFLFYYIQSENKRENLLQMNLHAQVTVLLMLNVKIVILPKQNQINVQRLISYQKLIDQQAHVKLLINLFIYLDIYMFTIVRTK